MKQSKIALSYLVKMITESGEASAQAKDELTSEAFKISQYVRFCQVMQSIDVLLCVLAESGNQTGTVEALRQFHAEFMNRLFIMNVTGELHGDDLIDSVKKFSESHLSLCEVH
jgi:hypothetical protein